MNDTTTLPLRNPRTGQSDGQLPIVPADAVAALGQALRAAQPAWAALDIEARCQRLSALADALVARRDAMVELLLAETYRHAQEAGIQFILVACEAPLYGLFEHYGFREYLPPAVLPNGLALLRMVLVTDGQAWLAGCGSPLLPLVRNATAGRAAHDWLLRIFPDAG